MQMSGVAYISLQYSAHHCSAALCGTMPHVAALKLGHVWCGEPCQAVLAQHSMAYWHRLAWHIGT